MSRTPLVSIITPSYNQGQFLESTIRSVIGQTYKNIQYIIVDGGSTDDSMAVAEKYRGEIDILISEKDKGQSDAINKGFRLAKGELVGWINSDDMLYPECVEKLVNTFNKKDDGVIYYGPICKIINKKGDVIRDEVKYINGLDLLLRKRYEVIQPGSFYKTTLVEQVGYLDEDIHYCMDLDLWLKLLQFGPIHEIEGYPVAMYREWEETKSTVGGKFFYRNIRSVLQKHGAPLLCRSVLKTYQYEYTGIVKNFLLRK